MLKWGTAVTFSADCLQFLLNCKLHLCAGTGVQQASPTLQPNYSASEPKSPDLQKMASPSELTINALRLVLRSLLSNLKSKPPGQHCAGLQADQLDKESLAAVNAYNPGLSGAWMLQRAMSVRPGRQPRPAFINTLLSQNFEMMERLGDPVLKPFLQVSLAL